METPVHRTYTLESTALVLVDHQVGTIGWAGEFTNDTDREDLKRWTRVITRFAVDSGIPVVMTSSLEDQAQGPLLPELRDIAEQAYDARIKRQGVINAWDDPAFAAAVRDTGRRQLLLGGLTTEVCLVPPALSARAEGFDVVALMDISGANTMLGAQNSRESLRAAGIDLMTVLPMITSMLGDYTNPASGAFFHACEVEGVYEAFARGSLR